MNQEDLARRLAELPLEKRALLFQQLQKQKEQTEPAAQPRIARVNRSPGVFRLSFAQQRLWFLNQYEPDSPEYNIPQGFRLTGPLDADALRRTLDTIAARHEALRTTFQAVDGEPMQSLTERLVVELPVTDLSGRPDGEGEALRAAAEDSRQPFDLRMGPLFRPLLFKIAADEHLFFLNVHHIVYDGWSRGVFLSELRTIYEAHAAGQPSPLPELEVQYLDFALWQREWLQGAVLDAQLGYWRDRLAGAPPLDLVTDRPRPALRTYNGDTEPVRLSKELAGSLTRLAQREGGTLFVALTATFKALLHGYTGQEDLAIGTLIAGRTRPEIEPLIGFFANTLALRTDLSGDPSFRNLVKREREVALGAYAHQDLPFEKLVEVIQPERDLARTPVFQTMLILLNAPGGGLELTGLQIEQVPVDSRTSNMEMTLYMIEGAEGLDGYLEYNTDLFDTATVQRFLGHFQALAAGVAADPDRPLSELPWLPDSERRQLLVDWNDTAAEVPPVCLHDLFSAQVFRTPEAPAVDFEGETLSYSELEGRANRLAWHLRRQGVGPEVLVGLAMERSFDLLVGVLAVLKAGGAYVPLDPEYPQERLAFMMSQARIPVLLTQQRLLEKLPAHNGRIVAVDRDAEQIEEYPASIVPQSAVRPENLAYVIYTSGSTGKPKGVQIPHAAVVNFLRSMGKVPGLTAKDTLLAVTTLSFDIAGLELYLPLVNGAKVVLVPRDVAQAGEQLVDRLVRSGTTVMQATPATWRLLLGAGWTGSADLKVLCGGEALPRDLADPLLDACGSLWNVYGPTEATIWSMVHRLEGHGGPIPIGKPIDNTQVYLLSPRLQPVPAGVPGELYIGGAGLARGYRGRPDLTAERFVPAPFSRERGARLYKTGDLARHLPDGTLEFLGRIDHQVKVRGFRIELGEIEAVLAQHPGIAQCVVLAREDTPGTKRLVAYLVAAHPAGNVPKTQELKDFLKERLPEYMVPALFVTLEAMPLTPNGKVDRRVLPAPDMGRSDADRPYVAPSTPAEQALAALWMEVLGVPRVGVHDDFFDLGGDSLTVIRVVSKANKGGLGITTKQLFQNRTVAALAKVAGTTHVLAEQGPVTGPVPFTPAQLHFLELAHTNPRVHALGSLLQARDTLDVAAAERALKALFVQHDNLRVRLVEDAGGAHLVTDAPWDRFRLGVIDLSALPAERRDETFREGASLARTFDLAYGPLFRGVVFDHGEDQFLFLVSHFFTADVGSWQVLLDDFDTGYRQARRKKPVRLQAKTTSARQWADRLAERAHSSDMKHEKEYWLSDSRRRAPRIPLDIPEGENRMNSSAHVRVELTGEETRVLLQDAQRAYGVQIDALLLTSVLQAFTPWTGGRSLLIDLLGHGREALYDDVDLTRTVGWFNTIYPACLELPESDDPVEAVQAVNRQLREIPNGGIGYGILRYLSRDQDFVDRIRSMPQPDIFFNYFGDDHSKELVSMVKLEGFAGYAMDRATRRLRQLAIGVYVQEDRMLLKWEYSKNVFRPETIEAVARRSQDALRWYVESHTNARGMARI